MQPQPKILTEIASDLAQKIPDLITKINLSPQKTIFISDQKIWRKYQDFFPKNFCDKFYANIIINNPKADEISAIKIDKQIKKLGAISILGFGSGTINDLCKYVAALNKIPYCIIPSAASMNGYLSSSASITINNHKKTILAKPPIAAFCDLNILAKSPKRMTQAGIGDLMCFYSCWFDWLISHKLFGTKFDSQPFDILRDKMEFFCKNYHHFNLNDSEFLRLLIEILFASGQGMTIANGSYPASQSEHLIAHTLSMKYPKQTFKILHGEMIAITVIQSCKLQKAVLNYLKQDPEAIEKVVKRNFLDDNFANFAQQKFFDEQLIIECGKEFAVKSNLVKNFSDFAAKKLEDLEQDLQKIYFSQLRLKKIFKHFKISSSYQKLGLTMSQYQKSVANARFIRNRITCLDLHSWNRPTK